MASADALLALFGKGDVEETSPEYLGALLLAEHLHIVRAFGTAMAKK